jgi:hypothetical protein
MHAAALGFWLWESAALFGIAPPVSEAFVPTWKVSTKPAHAPGATWYLLTASYGQTRDHAVLSRADKRVGIRAGSGSGLSPDFFVYLVKPEPESNLILTYLIKFINPARAQAQSLSLSPMRALNIQARPIPSWKLNTDSREISNKKLSWQRICAYYDIKWYVGM